MKKYLLLVILMASCNLKDAKNDSNLSQNSELQIVQKVLACDSLVELSKENLLPSLAGNNEFYTMMKWEENRDSIRLETIKIHDTLGLEITHFGYFPTKELSVEWTLESELLKINNQVLLLDSIVDAPLAFYLDNTIIHTQSRKILILNSEPRYILHTDNYHYLLLDITDENDIKFIDYFEFDASCINLKGTNIRYCYGFLEDKFYFVTTNKKCNGKVDFINLDSLLNVVNYENNSLRRFK